MGSDSGKLLADAIKAHTNFEQIAQNMFDGEAKVDMSKRGLDAGDAHIIAAALEKNDTVTQVNVASNGLGTEGGKALADCLNTNTTITQVRRFVARPCVAHAVLHCAAALRCCAPPGGVSVHISHAQNCLPK